MNGEYKFSIEIGLTEGGKSKRLRAGAEVDTMRSVHNYAKDHFHMHTNGVVAGRPAWYTKSGPKTEDYPRFEGVVQGGGCISCGVD